MVALSTVIGDEVSVFTRMPGTQTFIFNANLLEGSILMYVYWVFHHIATCSKSYHTVKTNATTLPQCWYHLLPSHFLHKTTLIFQCFGVKSGSLMVCVLCCTHQICQYHSVSNRWSRHRSPRQEHLEAVSLNLGTLGRPWWSHLLPAGCGSAFQDNEAVREQFLDKIP